ncbi:MAG: hypothetical protein IPJ37_24630 [Bacteroidales bacterium]|nr:hypothetical protein [Bacteroidales bacterium]
MKPTISPFNENFVFTHCDMTGVYITHNGGETWKMKNLWNVPDDFEFDTSDSGTVYIATRGFLHSDDRGSGVSLLLRSEDRGERWRIIYPDVSKSRSVEKLQSTNLLPSDIIEGAIDGSIQKISVSPSDRNTIYLGIAPLIDYMAREKQNESESRLTLVISSDFGSTWRSFAKVPGKSVKAIFPSSNGDSVTLFTESNCYSVDVKSGKYMPLPFPGKKILAAEGGRKGNGYLIYAVTEFKNENGKISGGIYLTRDEGKSWSQVNSGLSDGTAPGLQPYVSGGFAVCESDPEVAYLSAINPVKNAQGSLEAIYCIYKTNDAGTTWKPVLLSSTPGGYLTKNFRGSWMEESFDPGWGGNPIDLGVAPGNPDICYAGDNGRGYKTTDGGKSWTVVYSHNNADGSFSSSGLDVTTCYGVHFDPFNKDHFFICYTDMGLFHTFNSGRSWFHSLKGIPREWQNTCYQVAFDPDIKGKVWSVWANAHDLPRTKMFGADGFSMYQGGVAVSSDSGRKWQPIVKGLPENSVCTNILIDPASPAGSRIIYVSVFDRGIYKSSDGGISWQLLNSGLGDNLFAWQLRLDSRGRLFALFARGMKKGETVDGAVYCSDDGALTWKKINLPDKVNGPHDLLINPDNPVIMYLSCWPRTADGIDSKGGVIKSADGGKTWTNIFDDRVRVNSAGMEPKDPSVIYINTFQNAAYRSEDSGVSWKRIEGYRFKWGQRAIPDVNNPGMLYLSTYGGSVFTDQQREYRVHPMIS